MKKYLFLLPAIACFHALRAQEGAESQKQDTAWKHIYRATATRINDLVNTKLEAKFDYDKSYMYGKVWVTLKPHFYPTDSLTLDAKGMDIHKVALVTGHALKTLKYHYDGWKLRIHLDKTYKGGEKYAVFIDYTSKPNELKVHGSAAINDAKGLYFINPKGEIKDKPTQIWTQGETESTSAWCPTIDKPDQKCTDEISMTVPDKYVTLSNGKLVSQKKNKDGTRTDTWRMDLPHCPYLFFMGIGDYAIIKDHYEGKEVAYYVEKPYASVARKIFGHTPAMIAFYSKILGIDYPWVKYDQIVGRDYVSGAMENTTCTLHQESAQQDARELVDGNKWESTVAHELFHQWFGDLVTTESWSNLTLNESFANYSETLWAEHEYGKDAGDEQNYDDMQGYLRSHNDDKDLVRFYYRDREDVFDAVTYNKGGRILNMLRNYVGDSAFFKSLHLYLVTNKFKSAEAQQLRLAFEEVTGQDLNWFWNQWYYGAGQPDLSINYDYDDSLGQVKVIVRQTQTGQTFKLPIAIDVYHGARKVRHRVWVENKTDTFTFHYTARPDLVNVDGDKMLLCRKKDNKTLENYIAQYQYAGLYVDRREAIEYCAHHQEDPKALALLKQALKDKYYGLRELTLGALDMDNDTVKSAVEPILSDLAEHDPKPTVRGKALGLLAGYDKAAYTPLFKKDIYDSSYTVAGNALEGLLEMDSAAAYAAAKKLIPHPAKGDLMDAIAHTMIKNGDATYFDVIADYFGGLPLSQDKFDLVRPMCDYIAKVNETDKVKSGIDKVVEFRKEIQPYGYAPVIDNFMKGIIRKKESTLTASATNKTALQDQIDYIKSKIGEDK